jgi:iron complex transport system substrate-binding protein
MKNKKQGKAFVAALALLLVFSVEGTLYARGKKDAGGTTGGRTITVQDDTKRSVTIALPVQRVALLDSGLGTVLSALGVLDRVVGNHQALQNSLFAKIASVPMIATYAEINYEALVQTEPNLVLAATSHHGYVSDSDHLDEFGIQFIALDLRTPSRMRNDVKILGQVFEREAQAQKIIDFYDKYQKIIDERLINVPESSRPKVFFEMHAGAYHTGSPESQFYQQIELAGGVNIARSLADNPLGDDTEVSAEWVIERNPDYIVREVSSLGYMARDRAAIKAIYDETRARPGLNNTDAIKRGNLFLIGNDIISRPGYIVGVCYLAKEFFPDLFTDLSPESVLKEWFAIAYPGTAVEGLWFYSE